MKALLIGTACLVALALLYIAGKPHLTAQIRSPQGALEGPPMGKSDAEKKILAVLDDLDRNQRRGNMNVPVEDGRLLRILAESINASLSFPFFPFSSILGH